jgi:hypothetical protein
LPTFGGEKYVKKNKMQQMRMDRKRKRHQARSRDKLGYEVVPFLRHQVTGQTFQMVRQDPMGAMHGGGGEIMSIATISKPGSEFGPCTGSCIHRDCAINREMAQRSCRICGKAIGYETGFFNESGDWKTLVHASCLEEEIYKNT